MLKRFDDSLRRSLLPAVKFVRRFDRLLLLLILAVGLAGCYTTFRPPAVEEQPPAAVMVPDSTRAETAPAPQGEEYEYEPPHDYGWNNYWGWGYNSPYWGGFYPYWYYQNSPWGYYYYQPWWGNYYNSPYYPYYPYYPAPAPGPSQPGTPPQKRSFEPRGNTNNPPPPPPPQNQGGYSAPPQQNQGQGQQNPQNNDDNKKRETDRRGRRG